MPDIAQVIKFQKKMISVEENYLRAINSTRRETRRVLLDIVERDGVSRSAVNQMVNVVDNMSRQLNASASIAARDARNITQGYMRKQLQMAQKAKLTEYPDVNAVFAQGENALQDATQAYFTNTSAWVKTLETSLQTNSAKLRLSDAPLDETVNRLFSERLADGRASVWLSSGNAAQSEETTNIWTFAGSLLAVYMFLFNQQEDALFQKQAIATIDSRTTDCCLRVHGQIQPLSKPFLLTGTPRFANKVQDPPFHWYCRSTEVLYNPAFEEFGITTEKMIEMAKLELDFRDLTGKRTTIYPSHSTSRRAGQLPSG